MNHATDANPLTRYLVPLRRWWPILAGTVALGLVIAWVSLPDAAEVPSPEELADPEVAYQATEILIRARETPTTSNFDLVVLLIQQGEVANRVVDAMDGEVDIDDVQAVEVTADGSLGTLSITAVQPTPERSVALVDTYARAVTDFFDERADASLQEHIDRTTSRLATIDDRIRDLEGEIATLPPDDVDRRLLEAEVEVLIDQYAVLQAEARDLRTQDPGGAPTFETLQGPVAVSTSASILPETFDVPESGPARFVIAIIAALLIGAALIFAVDWVDTRVRTRRDAEEWFGLPVIAELPRRSRKERSETPLPAHGDPMSHAAEAFRTLRLAVQNSPIWHLNRSTPTSNGSVGSSAPVAGGQRRTVLVTSSQIGEGKSTVAANLAVTFAEAGREVLIIDCDFRRSTLPALLGLKDGAGLRDLPGPQAQDIAGLVRTTPIKNVRVIASGSPGITPSWFLSDARELVEHAQDLADIVIFDAGPLLATNEASALIPHVDTLVLVARSGRIARDQATRTTEHLARLSAKVSGIAIVGAEGTRHYGYYEPIRKAAERGEKLVPSRGGRPGPP